MRHLNYVTAVLLDRSQDSTRDGVVCKGCGMDMGFDLVYALSYVAAGDGYPPAEPHIRLNVRKGSRLCKNYFLETETKY